MMELLRYKEVTPRPAPVPGAELQALNTPRYPVARPVRDEARNDKSLTRLRCVCSSF
jgi:hypothetical protein